MTGSEAEPGESDPVIRALKEMLDANRGLQHVLQASEARIEEYLRLISAGARTADVARASSAVTSASRTMRRSTA